MLISFMILLVMMMISVGFFTLLERKMLSYIQIRVGPSKVGYKGLVQPFADGGKLFMKEFTKLFLNDLWIFSISPLMGMTLCLLMWSLYSYEVEDLDFDLGILFFFCVSGVGVYTVILSGWSSNSSYSVVGAYRSVAQSISYEVVSALIVLGVVGMVGSYDLVKFNKLECEFLFISSCSCLLWFSILLAETNRSPYDFAEGESELVSGFNVEYSSIGFSLLFMTEYGNIMFMAYVSSYLVFGSGLILNSVWLMIFMLVIVWVRGSFPRLRYDKLMKSAWKEYLLISLSLLIFVMGVCSFIEIVMS